LGTQNLPTQVVVVGNSVDFSEEKEFGGRATSFLVSPANGYTVKDEYFTFKTIGNYAITMTNDAIKSDPNYPAKVIAHINVSGVGVETKTKDELGITVSPNPTTGQLRITNYELRENTVIEIYDVYGKKHVSQFTFHDSHIEIDISHLANGMYFLKLTTNERTIVKKIIKH